MTTTDAVPGLFDVAINGRPYMLDRVIGQTRVWTQPVSRVQSDTSDRAGEQSLAREQLWRRTITSWHHGAGQQQYDDLTGDPYRFRKSLGIDIWTPGQIKPIGGLSVRGIAGSTGNIGGNGQMVLFNGLPYVNGSTNGASLYNTWDPSTVVATVPNGFMSLCTDGAVIYAADRGGGGVGGTIYTTTAAGGAATSYKTGTYYLVRYAKGRLWAANATQLVNVTSGSAETVAYTDPTTNWTWTDVVPGAGCVLASGYDQTQSFIVAVGILPDGSAINTGTVIAEMPAGERVTSMHATLGYVLVGTNKGVRVCQQDGTRFIIGPLIDTFSKDANNGVAAPSTTAVRCFASFDRFVYFGWSFYDWTGQSGSNETSGSFYAGLGRINLAEMLAPLQPAYATDVMVFISNNDVHTPGEVTGCAVDKYGTPTFVLAGDKCYFGALGGVPNKSQYSPLGSGPNPYMWMGRVLLGIDDLKVPARFQLRTSAEGSATVTAVLVDEAGTSTTVFTTSAAATITRAALDAIPATTSLEPKLTWPADHGSSIVQKVYDARIDAWPTPPRLERYQLAIRLTKAVTRRDGQTHIYASLVTELDALRTLASPSGRQIVDVQIGGSTYQMVVDDIDFRPDHTTTADVPVTEWGGTCLVTLSRGLD